MCGRISPWHGGRGQHRLYKPIIAAINGYAIGAGLEFALACDIRIASETAKFGVFEVRHGLHQGDGGLVRLVAVAGVGVALDLTLTGGRFRLRRRSDSG